MKMTQLMMLAPFVLKMSDIEHIVNAVDLPNADLDKKSLQEELACTVFHFREILDIEKKYNDDYKKMVSCVDKVRRRSNLVVADVLKHGYFLVASLQDGAKKHLLKKEPDPSRLARIAFDPGAADELVHQKILQLREFVAFMNDVHMEMLEHYHLSSKKITSQAHIDLFHDKLRKVYDNHFPGGSGLPYDPVQGKHFGPYLRFSVAVAEKYSIGTRKGCRYAEGSIVEFIRGRPPRSHRSRARRRAVRAELDTG